MTSRIGNPDTPSDVELRSVLDRAGSFVMIAGAGSGKTTSLVKAMDYVAKSRRSELVRRGQQVACITYTEIAVEELLGDLGHDKFFHISTIHSFLWTLIRPFQQDIRSWVEGHNEETLAELLTEQEGFKTRPRVRQTTKDEVAQRIIECESLRADLKKVKKFSYETGRDYRSGVLGHDDIIKMVPSLITKRPLLRRIIAQKYPYLFVDESQDTVDGVVLALTSICEEVKVGFCLGFFGDPMQKIYTSGRGVIDLKQGWTEIKKPENFRCPTKVLSVINQIRMGGDKLQQTAGIRERNGEKLPQAVGTARMFVLPVTDDRAKSVERVRKFLADKNNDPLWSEEEAGGDVRILVIEHKMAANRLGFAQIFSAFNSGTADSVKAGFREGTAWAIKPFQDVLLPLVEARLVPNEAAVFALLRKYSPALRPEALKAVAKPADLLVSLNKAVDALVNYLQAGSTATVRDVLAFARDTKLVLLDDRLGRPLQNIANVEPDSMAPVVPLYFDCPAREMFGYRTYIEGRSPYATQQGVKGAEFQRVLMIVDDEESAGFLFSYDKYFGLVPPSKTDEKNKAEGNDTVFDRTRRLFYVCCSRALKDLAVICYTKDPAALVGHLKAGGFFPEDDLILMPEA